MARGLLTLCTNSDWHKAIAMAVSAKLRNPEIRLAVVTGAAQEALLNQFFDHVIPERTDISGFAHKLYLDEYTPFEETLFVDADMLWFKDPHELFECFEGRKYGVRGGFRRDGFSNFGVDYSQLCVTLGVQNAVHIDGAGHGYFTQDSAGDVFPRAREILNDYHQLQPGLRVADEDIIARVMTERDIDPVSSKNIVGFPRAIKKHVFEMDILLGTLRYIDLEGDDVEPVLMHFPRDMSPYFYKSLMEAVLSNAGVKLPVNFLFEAFKDDVRTWPSPFHRLRYLFD